MRRTAGFTLLEMLLVIAIISILVAVAIPRFKPNQEHANLRLAAQQLQNDLLYLRQLAETEEIDQTICFFEESRYALNPADPANPTANDDIRSLPLNIRLLSVTGVDDNKITFDKQGKLKFASDLNVVVLTLAGRGSNAPQASITVNKNTGLTEVTYP